jgi:hypothetical protein
MAAPLGNQNAARAKQWRDAIVRQVTKRGGSLADGLALAAEKLVAKAIDDGERWALEELGNRLDGKPAQAIIGDAESDPVQMIHKVVREVVRANADHQDG